MHRELCAATCCPALAPTHPRTYHDATSVAQPSPAASPAASTHSHLFVQHMPHPTWCRTGFTTSLRDGPCRQRTSAQVRHAARNACSGCCRRCCSPMTPACPCGARATAKTHHPLPCCTVRPPQLAGRRPTPPHRSPPSPRSSCCRTWRTSLSPSAPSTYGIRTPPYTPPVVDEGHSPAGEPSAPNFPRFILLPALPS